MMLTPSRDMKRSKSLKTVGPDGLPAELLNTDGNAFIGRIYRLIYKIWLEENMLND